MGVLVDAGPLVAIESPDDYHHERCTRALEHLPAPLLTCWPVIAEAAWLLRGYPLGFERVLGSFREGFLDILPVTAREAEPIAQVMKQYVSLRPQFADAMLVYLAGREKIDTIFTLDRRDFSVYRTARNRAFHIVPE